jgi:hypothetical protein
MRVCWPTTLYGLKRGPTEADRRLSFWEPPTPALADSEEIPFSARHVIEPLILAGE